MKKENRGITLIALVITIIVMLILVGVTISMAVNGGLFDYAGKAVGQTNNALKAEQQLADGGIEVDGVLYDSIDDYLEKINFVTPTSIIIEGPDTLEVRREITLEAYNQVNQKVDSEDIEWKISWTPIDDDESIVATVNDGVVKGVNISAYEFDVSVTITATYIPNRTVVATKSIVICPFRCTVCGGTGRIFKDGLECPECKELYADASSSVEEYWVETCYACGYAGYVLSASAQCPACGDPNVDSGGLSTYGPYRLFTFPCGHSSFAEYLESFYNALDKTCDVCSGEGYFLY